MTLRGSNLPTGFGPLSFLALLLIAGCAGVPAPQATGPVFYPSLPNPPRIQYLTSFTQARDAGGRLGGFAEFVLGKESDDDGAVKKPYGVAVHDGKVFAVDTRGPGYAVFDLVGRKFKTVPGDGAGRMSKPINITIDRDGNRYVTDTGREQVLVYDRDDRYVRAFGVKEQFRPVDVAIHGDRLYVADIRHHRIHVLDKRTGATLFTFANAGSKDGELYQPTNLALSGDGHLYVTDTGNFRVQVFTLDGKFVRVIGGVGTGLGQFARPKGVAVDRVGRLYVVDAAFENIQVFDADGRLLLFFGAPGDAIDSLNLPTDVEIDYDNVALFQPFADPKFRIEYVILVGSQFGRNKVSAFGFGRLEGMDYSATERAPAPAR
jgi:DNA-binding beta-propeller fold protein YncE